MAAVDLIIPTFNGAELLRACLETLQRSTYTDFRLVVIDDGSDVPVAPMVHAAFPDALVIRFETNQGLTRGFNAALAATESEYVVFLNDDTEVEEEWLSRLVACADRHPGAGSIASKLRLASDRHRIHSAGDYYTKWGMPGNRGVWLEDYEQYDIEGEIFSACAGAALYRRSALDAVQLDNGDWFDTRLFMYCDDVDIAWRLQRAGYTCVFAPDAVVYHHLSATGGGALASYYVFRNVWYVLANSVPGWYRRMFLGRALAWQAGFLFRTLRRIGEPAARRSLAGWAAGLLWFVRHREPHNAADEQERTRILGLLADRERG